jgi:hypothetical protein
LNNSIYCFDPECPWHFVLGEHAASLQPENKVNLMSVFKQKDKITPSSKQFF